MIPKVTDNIATLALAKYNRPVAVSIIPSGQTWRDRQIVQYNALLGLMKEDFHGLDDFKEQMGLYSSTSYLLKPGWMAIRPLVTLNRKLLMRLMLHPRLGMWVGRALLKVVGFDKAFALPAEILEDNAALKGRLV
jgi:hypothetical protein